jgi:hypothetical protein
MRGVARPDLISPASSEPAPNLVPEHEFEWYRQIPRK